MAVTDLNLGNDATAANNLKLRADGAGGGAICNGAGTALVTIAADGKQTFTNQLKSGTTVTCATGSPTYIDFTGIPSWVKRITLLLKDVSTSGSANWVIQIGNSGGFDGSGYQCIYGYYQNASASVVASASAGFFLPYAASSISAQGAIRLELLDAATNTWICTGQVIHAGGSTIAHVTGSKVLSSTLDRVRLTQTGSDTFDAGIVNILYE